MYLNIHSADKVWFTVYFILPADYSKHIFQQYMSFSLNNVKLTLLVFSLCQWLQQQPHQMQ